MVAIIKKEFKSYLCSPIGYIFIGSFLLMLGYIFYMSIFMNKSINFERLYSLGSILLTFTIPLLTMRMFSEEKKSGTDQILFTAPVDVKEIVLGKFLAAVLIIVLTEIFSLMYFIILLCFGHPSFPVTVVTLFGFTLLSMSYISLGMFVSSLTENQIVSGILTALFFIVLLILPGISKILKPLSPLDLFSKFSVGIISVQDCISYIAFISLFIALTVLHLKKRKLK